MEKEIIEIISKMLGKNQSEVDYNKIPNEVYTNFNKLYFNKFESVLIENATIYALENNKEYYKKLVKFYNEKYESLLNNDVSFKTITTKYAMLNLYNKLYKNIDNSKSIKEFFPDYFTFLEDYIFITDLFRNILLSLIESLLYDFDDEKKFRFIDELLYTNKHDNHIKKECSLITEDTINFFKKIVTRFILSDNYLYYESLKLDQEIDNMLNELAEEQFEDNFGLDDIEERDLFIDENILEYIEECINNNKFIMPRDKNLRYDMYDIFIDYNLTFQSQTHDINNLEDNNKILELKKINPFYFLEKKYF